MKQVAKARGIVLGKRKFKETDILIDFICEQGERKIFCVHGILGSKNRNMLLYDPGNYIEVDYYTGSSNSSHQIQSIKESNEIKSFSGQFSSYKMLSKLSFLLETIDISSKEIGNHELFLVLLGGLDQLILSAKKPLELSLLFMFVQIRCLKSLAVLGEDSNCSSCDSNLKDYANWQFPEMHFLCLDCSTKPKKNDIEITEIISSMRKNRFSNILNKNPLSLPEQNLGIYQKLNHKLKLALEHTTGWHLKSKLEN